MRCAYGPWHPDMSPKTLHSPVGSAPPASDARSKTILVTGGAGFIGSSLVRHLLGNTDYYVANVDKLTYAGNLDSLDAFESHERHRFFRVDICDSAALRAVFEEVRPSGVIHLAAESHVDRSIDAPAEFIMTNVVGTFTLLEESLRYWRALPGGQAEVFRFLHVSTDEVFGELGEAGAFTEQSAYQPNSPYSASKAGSDHLVRAWHHTFGLPTLTTNCSNNYGPYQFPEKLIPLVVQKALHWEAIPVYGRGENIRDWLFVADHARALLTAWEKGTPGRTYVVGGRSERSNLEVVHAICDLLDELRPDASLASRRDLVTFVRDRPGHDFRYAIDPTCIERELDWHPRETFESGLRTTVEWYLANGSWTERVQSGAYRGERLGLAMA